MTDREGHKEGWGEGGREGGRRRGRGERGKEREGGESGRKEWRNLPIVCSKHSFYSTAGLTAEVKWTHYQVSDGCSHWSRRYSRRL